MGWQVWCGPLGSSSARNICLICFFKARSIGTSRRRSDISTFIQDNNIDIMLLMETWLCPADDKPRSLIWLCPGTRSSPSPQAARGPAQKAGGIAFIRNSLKPHGTTTLSFPVQHPCFETAQLTLTYNKQLSNFCIYHHPAENKFADSLFFKFKKNQFSSFLEHSDSLPGKTLLMSNFNFYFENVANSNSRKLHNVIDMFNLTECVSKPTHNQGHLLDLVFSKQSDNILI